MKKKKFELKVPMDFLDFIQLCNKHSVEYLVIGGYAVSIYGYPRSTKDMDVCIKRSEVNARKMIDVLNEFGFGSLGINVEDFLKFENFTQLGQPPLRIDIINELQGLDFDVAFENRKEVLIDEVVFNFIGYNDLLKLKELAGRPQDIADISKLKNRNK